MGRPIAFEVTPITTGPKNHLFGYIGQSLTIPWNESGRYIVAMRTDFFKRMPGAGETADIVIIDTANGYEVTKVDTTRAWNLQKGTMLYWNPNSPETQFFFNDRDPETEDIFTVLFDISTMKRVKEYRFGPGPSTVANTGVAPNGRYFAAVNHGRNSWREVVSYAGAVDETRDATVNPNTEGLFRVDIETGERTLIISYQALVTSLASLGYAVDPASPLSIHRTCWNRDSNRIDFVVRWPVGVAVEFVIRTDGTNLAQIPSPRHPEWLDGPVMTCENKEGWLDLYNVDTASYTSDQIGSKDTFKDTGADRAYSPDGKWIVCTYTSNGSWHYQFYRFSDGAVYTATTTLTYEGANPKTNATRIDGAPRWNRTSDAILVGGIVTENNPSKGTRQMAMIRLVPG
ncbi:MAG TPA: hypothetical protein DHW45_11075 [Candidatus Latescibacteria bacterium]|nr:hypothetical protein [Candidatus Latescibacterota bacterium]